MTKTKSRHHKTENTHRFQTLAERLSHINVDVVKRINRNNIKPEVLISLFLAGHLSLKNNPDNFFLGN
jgi:hypothetical protein